MCKRKIKIYYTILLSALSVLISCGINFFLTPYVTNTVGAEAYGFVSLARNFVSFANILMIALNSYAARFITISYLRKDFNQFEKYYSTVFIADLIAGGILFIVGLVCVIYLQSLLNISPHLVSDVKLLFLLTFLSFYLTTMSTIYTTTAYVKDRLDLSNLIKILSYIIEALILIFCFAMLRPFVWYVGIASLGMAATVLIGSLIVTRHLMPEGKVRINCFSFAAVKQLLGNGLWNSANSLGNSLNSGLDLLITNLMLSGTAMGQVSIAKTLSGMLYQLYDTASQPFQPSFLQDYSKNDKQSLLYNLKHSMYICGMITNTVFAGFFAVGLKFYQLWIPTQNIHQIYVLTILAMIPSITEGCVYPLYYIYTLTLKNKFPCVVTIIGGFANVAGMYLLLRFTSFGAYAVLLTTAVVMNIINLVTNPIYMSKCLKVSTLEFYPAIIRNIVSCLITTALLWIITCKMNFPVTWGTLVLQVLILAFTGFLVQIPVLFGLSGYKTLYDDIKKLVKRRL